MNIDKIKENIIPVVVVFLLMTGIVYFAITQKDILDNQKKFCEQNNFTFYGQGSCEEYRGNTIYIKYFVYDSQKKQYYFVGKCD
jgi:hypothetical protein